MTASSSAGADLHGVSAPGSHWSTTNIGEAMPGVLTPLGWSVWGPCGERAARTAFHRVGALTAAETAEPADPTERFLNIFYGRTAAQVDFMMRIGDLMPGTSGEAIANQILGSVPAGYQSRPSRRRWPVVAVRFPAWFVRTPRLIRECRPVTDAWWRAEIAAAGTLDLADARRHFQAARQRFQETLTLHTTGVIICMQPVYDLMSRLATAAGVDGSALLTGHGSHEETAVVADLWEVSRGRLGLAAFLDRHGYHGADEGELSSRMWRENPDAVARLVDRYRSLPDEAAPAAVEGDRAAERRQAEAALLAGLARWQRAPARLAIAFAARISPLRGVGKVAFLQSLDVLRAMARRIGACLAKEGLLADPEDAFFLTADELAGEAALPEPSVIADRRRRHEAFRALRIPSTFQGVPTAEPAGDHDVTGLPTLTGTGASPGVVEGRVVVVEDPATADVEPGDILVAHTTDPSWASIMFLAKALVVDIGGLLSHAAVVARELGIPCVMHTTDGTSRLRTGDLCRVDGSAGTVEVLSRGGRCITS
ncbi:MAG TPA: PEP-utilizing enzyme [Acidimicrobiia bacterium]|jgi:pyruvate,water dikinase